MFYNLWSIFSLTFATFFWENKIDFISILWMNNWLAWYHTTYDVATAY